MSSHASQPITSCFSCPVGRASSVGHGGMCPWVTRSRRPGELIHVQDEPAHMIWFVKRGAVALTRVQPETDGKEHVQSIRGAGSFVGLEALVRPTYTHQAHALWPTTLCGATKDTADAWLGTAGSPARTALEQVLHMMVGEAPRTAGTDGSAVRRVARWICDEAEGGVAPPIPRRTVASLLGMTPETFSRALAQLAKDRIVQLTRKHLAVIDDGALRRLAGRSMALAAMP